MCSILFILKQTNPWNIKKKKLSEATHLCCILQIKASVGHLVGTSNFGWGPDSYFLTAKVSFSQISCVRVLLHSRCEYVKHENWDISLSLPLQHLPWYNHHSCLGIKNQLSLSLSPTDTHKYTRTHFLSHTDTCRHTHSVSLFHTHAYRGSQLSTLLFRWKFQQIMRLAICTKSTQQERSSMTITSGSSASWTIFIAPTANSPHTKVQWRKINMLVHLFST